MILLDYCGKICVIFRKLGGRANFCQTSACIIPLLNRKQRFHVNSSHVLQYSCRGIGFIYSHQHARLVVDCCTRRICDTFRTSHSMAMHRDYHWHCRFAVLAKPTSLIRIVLIRIKT